MGGWVGRVPTPLILERGVVTSETKCKKFNRQGLFRGETLIETIYLFPLPYYKKAIDSGFRYRLHNNILLQIENFVSNNRFRLKSLNQGRYYGGGELQPLLF